MCGFAGSSTASLLGLGFSLPPWVERLARWLLDSLFPVDGWFCLQYFLALVVEFVCNDREIWGGNYAVVVGGLFRWILRA